MIAHRNSFLFRPRFQPWVFHHDALELALRGVLLWLEASTRAFYTGREGGSSPLESIHTPEICAYMQ